MAYYAMNVQGSPSQSASLGQSLRRVCRNKAGQGQPQ